MQIFNLNHKIFRSVANSDNGEVDASTRFHYHQDGDVIWADYAGGAIVKGHLLGKILPNGELDFRYHHINTVGEMMVGVCRSTPQILADGRLRFEERWQWLSGDQSAGYSEIEEVNGFQDITSNES